MTYQGSQLQMSNLETARREASKKTTCQYCDEKRSVSNMSRHEKSCHMNPNNLRLCPVCGAPIKHKDNITCSYSCSNTMFRSGTQNGNWKQSTYRSTCFLHHPHKCAICDEERIVQVHHLDEDKNNNSVENLVPLCPTHHQYWHSRYRYLIEEAVLLYVENFNKTIISSVEVKTA